MLYQCWIGARGQRLVRTGVVQLVEQDRRVGGGRHDRGTGGRIARDDEATPALVLDAVSIRRHDHAVVDLDHGDTPTLALDGVAGRYFTHGDLQRLGGQ